MKVVIADAGPLIIFAMTDNFFILKSLFQQIIIPKAVFNELAISDNLPGAKVLKKEIDSDFIKVEKIKKCDPRTLFLDRGEAEAISLALKKKLPLLIDEKRGRLIASKSSLTYFGSGRILISAKKKKIINAPKEVMDQFMDSGYRIYDKLYKKIVELSE